MVATTLDFGKGAESHLPDDKVIDQIAAKANVPISSLTTLTVSNGTCELYNAISEYSAVSAKSTDGFSSLFVCPGNPYEREEVSDDEDNDSSRKYPFFPRRISRGGDAYLQAGRGLEKPKGKIPRLLLGLGQTTIVWPPLPRFRADVIAKQRRSMALGIESISNDVKKEAQGEIAEIDTDDIHRDVIYVIHYSRGPPQLKYTSSFVNEYEILLVSANGHENLRKFSREVIQWRIDKDYRQGAGRFSLYRFVTSERTGDRWDYEGLKRARPMDTVVLRTGVIEQIMQDTARFLRPETKAWYVRHGLPHRRCLLFYGPPGTGKTSTIRAMASAFSLNCCFLSMTTEKFSNQSLCQALSQIPRNALLVLEDVDSIFNKDRQNTSGTQLTFSGLLNALDGVVSTDGIITIMTTNFIERLDQALIRGGRVDRKFMFATPNKDQISRLFKSFYPNAAEDLADKFASIIMKRPEGDEAKGIGTVQQIFIQHFDGSPEKCVEGIPAFYEAYFPSPVETEGDKTEKTAES